ncbi:hypothetical protein H6F95_07655 [Cyanobacteria bacterium FACHB-471]|nr:hypothetical protein [Cyanobacteria bacterium FACHB-471]
MQDSEEVSKLAKQVLRDPVLLQKLSDRVYEIMLQDLRNQRDRCPFSRRLF